MSLRYLLDTMVISILASKLPDQSIVKAVAARAHECAIAAPVWHELVYGCCRLPSGKRRTFLESYLDAAVRGTFPILPYDEAAADWHARERFRLDAQGRSAPFVDGQIAAVAHVNDLVLVTCNTRDFSAFERLRLEDWSERSSER